MTRIARVYKHAATNENSSDLAVSSSIFAEASIFVGAEREENLSRNDPDKSKFTSVYLFAMPCVCVGESVESIVE